jgi:holo-[acyl-carrier protein] synthase
MILGIGNDVVSIARIESALSTHGERFETRSFTPAEITLAKSRNERYARTLALRFAAKEAAVKALGTGFRGGIRMCDVEVVNDAVGKPELRFHGAAGERMHAITPAGMCATTHLSLSDDDTHAWAVVLVEAIPA